MSTPRYKVIIDPLGARRTVEVDAHGNEVRVIKREGILGGLFRGTGPTPAPPAPTRYPGGSGEGPITVGSRREAKLGEVGRVPAARIPPRPRDPELDSELEAMHSEIARLNARVGELEYEVTLLRGQRAAGDQAQAPQETATPEAAAPVEVMTTDEVPPTGEGASVFFDVPPPQPSDVPWFAQPSESEAPTVREQPEVQQPEL